MKRLDYSTVQFVQDTDWGTLQRMDILIESAKWLDGTDLTDEELDNLKIHREILNLARDGGFLDPNDRI